jgi:hypothetical protein
MVTHRYPIIHTEEAFRSLIARVGLKVMVIP